MRSRVLDAGSKNASGSVLDGFAVLFIQIDRTVNVISGASTRDIDTVCAVFSATELRNAPALESVTFSRAASSLKGFR